ncbi:MAG: metal ABC transporter substrate-binding protein [Phycisphaeraceae bacterium]
MQRNLIGRAWTVSLAALALAMVCLVGCGGADASDDARPTVVATTTMIADATRIIAGDDLRVVGLMRDGEDPHVYQPTPQDGNAIADADLVLANGLHLESKLDKLIQGKASRLLYLAEQDGIEPIADAGAESAADPHCWMDVTLFRTYVTGIRDALIELDPEREDAYTQRAADYLAELDTLHAWVIEQFESVPAERRVIITSHDAFNYFGRAYGVEVHGIVGISTEQQASPRDIQRLEEMIRDKGIRAVFYETSVKNTLNEMIKQIAEETGVEVGGSLYSDSLGEQGTEAGTYIGMIRHNTTTMVEALK